MTALQYAARSPGRTEAVVLIGAWAGVTRSTDLPVGVDPEAVDAWVQAIAQSWGSGWSVDADCPSMRTDERYRAWAARLERHTYSPTGIAQVLRVAATYDVRPLLSSVSAPTLLLHRAGDRMASVEQARFIASRIPDATYIELGGEEHMYFLGDQHVVLDAILRFLDERLGDGALTRAARKAERKGAYALGWQSLSRAELDVAVLVAAGMTNKEVAGRLRKSPHTVDGHLRRIYAKLDVSSRVGVANAYARVARSGPRGLPGPPPRADRAFASASVVSGRA
jgi:DNA-binding CsgD family transcriptional regulator